MSAKSAALNALQHSCDCTGCPGWTGKGGKVTRCCREGQGEPFNNSISLEDYYKTSRAGALLSEGMSQATIDQEIQIVLWSAIPPNNLPWIPVKNFGRTYSDTLDYKKWEGSDNQKLVKLMLKRAIGFTFPVCLSGRYHSMDCAALLENRAVEKIMNNLANANQAFMFYKAYGIDYWNSLVFLYQKPSQDFFRKSMTMMCYLHNSPLHEKVTCEMTPEECKSASEFLLNPWVLIQLPWHPVIYHQWLATVLAEVLLAKRELVEFHHWPIPKNLHHLVSDLFVILETLYCRIVLGMRLITWRMKQCPKVDAKVVGAILDLVVLPSIPAIKFVASGNYSDVARALKRMAWPKEGRECKEGDDMAAQFQMKIDHSDTIYGLDFWGKEDLGDLFGAIESDIDIDIQKLQNLSSDIPPARFLPCSRMYRMKPWSDRVVKAWQCNNTKIKSFAEEQVKPWLGGEVDFHDLPWEEDDLGLTFSNLCLQFQDAVDVIKGVIKPDTNIIHTLHCLQAQMNADESVASMTFLSYSALKAKNKDVFLLACGRDSPEMTIRKMEDTLQKLKTESFGRKWLENCLPVACRVDVNPDERCPDLEDGDMKVINSLEMRIKKLVFNMYKKSSLGIEESIFYPDWQLVQYLLPSFVTMISDWPTNKKTGLAENLIAKARFVLFLHHIISSFELKLREPASSEESPSIEQMFNITNSLIDQIKYEAYNLTYYIYGHMNKTLSKNPVLVALSSVTMVPLMHTLFEVAFLIHHYRVAVTWADEVQNLVSRIKFAIAKVNHAQCSSPAARYMLDALGIMKEMNDVAVSCKSKVQSARKPSYIFNLAEAKIMEMKAEGLNKSMDRKFTSEACMLSAQQLLGIILYICVNSLKSSDGALRAYFLKQKPANCSELLRKVFEACLKEEWHKVKILLTPLWSDEKHNDLSLVPYAVAKRFHGPYKEVLDHLKSCGGELNENSVVPVKFCRSCKNFKCELMKCSICVDNPDFPDIHWFCGVDCEKKGLDEGHFNDHDYDLMVKCGLFDP